jgi:galactonate dehydratase
MSIDRRDFLAGAGTLFMSQAVSGQDNPAAQVQDKGSSIRITALKAISAHNKLLVKIDTNMKVSGWGEIADLEPNTAAALAESLFELLDGENPTRIEYLWQKLYRSHRDMRGGPFMTHTISGIDMALWDITGKLWGVPVYRLLGGPTRDKIRLYNTPKAHKVGTGGPWPWSGNPSDVQHLVDMVKDVRKRVGPDGSVMFDAHCAVPPPMLIQFAAAIEPYDVLWIEEPAVAGNIEVFKRLKQSIRIPLATGELDRTIWGVMPYLQERCIDILQPDCCHTGGITQMKKIAALAEAYQVPLAPHNTATEVGLTASLQVAAAIPLLLIHEHAYTGPTGITRKTWELGKDGTVSLPQGPGLGIEVDEEAIAKLGAQPNPKPFKWPKQTYSDGSVREY